LVWAVPTGAGLSTAPLVANGVVYIGSRDGIFYALNATTGAELWSHTTEGPIETSAALSEDGSVVLFGSEDMHAYALNSWTGQLLWRTRLVGGQSMRDRWPVVVGDTVIFRTQPLVNNDLLMQEEDALFDSLGPNPRWSVERRAIIGFLEDNPHYRDFYVLNIHTGAERFVSPVLHNFGYGEIADMPVVNRDTAKVYVRYRFTGGFLNELGIGEGASLRYAPAIGELDLGHNNITPVDPANPADFNFQFRLISDEPTHFSMAGSMLFIDTRERVGGLDVETRELFEVANMMDDWYGEDNPTAKAGPMPIYDATFPYYPAEGVQSEGRSWRPTVIANGTIYWMVTCFGDDDVMQASAIAAIRTR
jgi:hypothetical protein